MRGRGAQVDEDYELGAEEDRGGSSDKPLSSKFRGVCWNRKNRRWQAAINSGGKYVYLGSFLEEKEAARAFDKAAVKLRGMRAKLNFAYSEYVDEQGNLLDDPKMRSVMCKIEAIQGGGGIAAANDASGGGVSVAIPIPNRGSGGAGTAGAGSGGYKSDLAADEVSGLSEPHLPHQPVGILVGDDCGGGSDDGTGAGLALGLGTGAGGRVSNQGTGRLLTPPGGLPLPGSAGGDVGPSGNGTAGAGRSLSPLLGGGGKGSGSGADAGGGDWRLGQPASTGAGLGLGLSGPDVDPPLFNHFPESLGGYDGPEPNVALLPPMPPPSRAPPPSARPRGPLSGHVAPHHASHGHHSYASHPPPHHHLLPPSYGNGGGGGGYGNGGGGPLAPPLNLGLPPSGAGSLSRHGVGAPAPPAPPPAAAGAMGGGVQRAILRELPAGCSLVALVPNRFANSKEEMCGALYTDNAAPGLVGSSVWTGSSIIKMGLYDTERDARQAAIKCMQLYWAFCSDEWRVDFYNALSSMGGGQSGGGAAAAVDPYNDHGPVPSTAAAAQAAAAVAAGQLQQQPSNGGGWGGRQGGGGRTSGHDGSGGAISLDHMAAHGHGHGLAAHSPSQPHQSQAQPAGHSNGGGGAGSLGFYRSSGGGGSGGSGLGDLLLEGGTSAAAASQQAGISELFQYMSSFNRKSSDGDGGGSDGGQPGGGGGSVLGKRSAADDDVRYDHDGEPEAKRGCSELGLALGLGGPEADLGGGGGGPGEGRAAHRLTLDALMVKQLQHAAAGL
ncbi:hypothetical protein HYH03_003771 [Edaphochlamys debaryana]|uniref:AP2/ERF domain-containing protein n=1 Tax=Edaphochlamys debaryana TaxID=47281 RepID=A0A836C386_9CHLO|nr:hypothetical protein HYH03_003771 [Edaphochlamys debaryana]|eukprot:KAG2498520.1 hypothetical protein HYH03_003771 [Edaphochlamys debaryana]